MSAFLCNPATFDLLADYAARRRVTLYVSDFHPAAAAAVDVFGTTGANLTQRAPTVAATLYAENLRSLASRYGADHDMAPDTPYRFRPCTIEIDPRQVLAAARCLEYQSCESADWDNTLAAQILCAIRREAERELTEGYGWDVCEETVRPPLVLSA